MPKSGSLPPISTKTKGNTETWQRTPLSGTVNRVTPQDNSPSYSRHCEKESTENYFQKTGTRDESISVDFATPENGGEILRKQDDLLKRREKLARKIEFDRDSAAVYREHWRETEACLQEKLELVFGNMRQVKNNTREIYGHLKRVRKEREDCTRDNKHAIRLMQAELKGKDDILRKVLNEEEKKVSAHIEMAKENKRLADQIREYRKKSKIMALQLDELS